MFKTTLLASIVVMGVGVASTASAKSLTIYNHTNHDSVTMINKGSCSSSLPGGITRAHSKNVVPEALLKAVCGKKDCSAEIYMSDHCGGPNNPVIATAVFNVKEGLKSISAPINGYSFQRDPADPFFAIAMYGGPAVGN